MRRALPLLLLIVLAGCKGNREKEVVGTWKDGFSQLALSEDKSFKGQLALLAVEGGWTMEGDDVVLTLKTISGKPAARFKAELQKSLSAVPAAQRASIGEMLKTLDLPRVLTLGADGKTLTTNAAKDKSQPLTLTKS